MPILPLDAPEPFAATLGVMLYPGADESDQAKARAFAAWWLAMPLRRFHQDGHRLTYEALASIAEDASEQLTDLDDRRRGGAAMGDLFKALFLLAKDHPALASWDNAIRVYEIFASRAKASGSRSQLRKYLSRFRRVAHLWGAWSFREGFFGGQPGTAYDGDDDFQCILAEAEILRDFGQGWRARRAKASPPLQADVWRVPKSWSRPIRQEGWPNPDRILSYKLPDDVITELRPPGRPRKRV
jgi:hypothetical protein